MSGLFTEPLLCAKGGAGAKARFPGCGDRCDRSRVLEVQQGRSREDSTGVKKRGECLCPRRGKWVWGETLEGLPGRWPLS